MVRVGERRGGKEGGGKKGGERRGGKEGGGKKEGEGNLNESHLRK